MSHAAQDAPRLDPTRFPREYGLSPGSRIAWVFTGLALVAIGALMLIVASTSGRGRADGDQAFLLAFELAMAAAAAWLILRTVRLRVTLDVDSVTKRGAFGERRMLRHEIAGVREVQAGRSAGHWKLVAAAGAGADLDLPRNLRVDQDFRDWLRTLPDLDAAELESEGMKYEAAVRELDERLGPAATRWLRHLGTVLSGGAIVLLLGIFLGQGRFAWLTWVALAWPWAALLALWVGRPLLCLGAKPKSGFKDISIALFGPGIALAVSMMGWVHVTRYQPVLLLLALGTGIMLAALAMADPAQRAKPIALALFAVMVGAPYGYGAGMLVDTHFDSSQVAIFQLPVIGKHSTSGKSTSYYLTVPAWGPISGADDINVGSREYQATAVGATICLGLNKGALGIPWYAKWVCPGNPP